MSVEVINYGGIITNIKVSDSSGETKDIAPGFNSTKSYINEH